MAQILVRDLSPEVVASLKLRAGRNRRSLQAEAKTILQEAVEHERVLDDFRLWSAEFLKRFEGRLTSDSAELVRADRAR